MKIVLNITFLYLLFSSHLQAKEQSVFLVSDLQGVYPDEVVIEPYTEGDALTYKVNNALTDRTPATVTMSEPKSYKSLFKKLGSDIDGEAQGDNSGTSISLSADGRTVAIGSALNGNLTGHVRIYTFSGDEWIQLGADIDGEAWLDASGTSVSLSADGQTVAIGAMGNDGANGYNSGHVRIYTFSGDEWIQLGADIDGEAAGDNSGISVSLSASGRTVAIGATYNDGVNGSSSGHVRIYTFSGDEWIQLGADIDGDAADDNSGKVSLSADGLTVAIGAPFNSSNGTFSGNVSVYTFSGDEWIQLGEDIDGEAARDGSGETVSLSADGRTVAIGALHNDGNGSSSGHVRIYSFSDSGWKQIGTDIDGEAAGDKSGRVSLSADGQTVAIGAMGNDGANGDDSGHVRIYTFSGDEWIQLGADIDGEAAGDNSGISVSLSADGRTIAIGAINNDGNNGNNSGHVRVFLLNDDIPPTINLSGDPLIFHPLGQPYTDSGAIAKDDLDTSVSVHTEGFVDIYTAGLYSIKYSAQDNMGNQAAVVTRQIFVALDTDRDGAPDNCDETCVALGVTADSDDDNDGVLDSADAYPLIARGSLTDTDSDGAPDTCDEACIALGMAADTDDDNDGISDQLEIANGLNPLDSTDATLDADNDGVSNIDEANAGSNISADDQPPIFTSTVSDIEVISTGLATAVELVNPTASDMASDVVVTNDSNGEFPVGITTVTYTATDLAGNTATLTQQVNVLPYLVISSGRSLGEGQIVEIDVTLNGTPATYPVTADIVMGGTASEDDFTLSTTSILITEGLTQTVSLSAVDDGFGDSGETVALSLDNLVNAGIKPNTDSEQIFTITEEQILPTVNVSVVQDDVISRTVDKQSNVLFDIDIEDPNGLDSLVVEWSGITSLSQVDSSPDLILDTSNLEAGIYVLRLSVTDNDVVGDNIVNQLITIKVIDTLPELTSVDSDGDGVSDIEEGLGDSDNDGIADYLDNTPQINLQPIGETFAQAQDGVTLALGATALAGDDNSIVIAPSSLPEDTTYEMKEVFDFTLTGLAVGASYELVLPLTQVIPENAIYRKLTDDGWVDFVEDANNAVHSASVSGNCPAINSDLWEAGLAEGGNCLKLTIQDGSSNDTDGLENGTVEDPSGIAVEKAPATPTPSPTPNTPTNGGGSSGGSNTIQVLILLWLLVIGRRIYLRP